MYNLERLRNVDVRTVDRNSLVDIKDVKINKNLPQTERIADFIRQVKNPYCYKCGKAVVKISFADTDVTPPDRLESFLKKIY